MKQNGHSSQEPKSSLMIGGATVSFLLPVSPPCKPMSWKMMSSFQSGTLLSQDANICHFLSLLSWSWRGSEVSQEKLATKTYPSLDSHKTIKSCLTD